MGGCLSIRIRENVMKCINVKCEGKPAYDIVIESGFGGLSEAFNKLEITGRKLCIVTDSNVAPLYLEQVEEQLRSTGVSNVSTNEVGKAILPFLRDLDVIAYLRFASVYRAFDTLEDFEEAIQALRERSQAGESASPEQTPVASKKARKPRTSRKRTAGQALLGDE